MSSRGNWALRLDAEVSRPFVRADGGGEEAILDEIEDSVRERETEACRVLN